MAGGAIDIEVRPDLSNFNSTLNRGLNGALKIGAQFGVAFGAATAFKEIVTLGNDLTNTLNTMQSVSGATAAEMSAVSGRAKELGNDISLSNTSATDAAAAMTELAKGGFSVQESMDGAKGTLQLAAAAGIDAASAATIQSQALQAFGLNADYAATAADVLANAANASSAEITDISSGLAQSGAVANQFGLTIEDTAATLGVLSNAGIAGSDAGTLLKSALLALTDQGKPAQAAIEELGLTVYDAEGKFVGMSTLFGELDEAAANMTPELYQAATATLFGSDAMRLAGIAAEQGQAGYDKMHDAVERQGAAAEVAAAKSKGLPGAIAGIQNSAETLALELYDLIDGPMEQFARGGADKLTNATDGIVGGFKTAGSVLAPVVGVVGDAASAIASLPGPVLAATGALVALRVTGLGTTLAGAMSATTAAAGRFTTAMAAQSFAAAAAGQQMGVVGAASRVAGANIATGAGKVVSALGGPWMIGIAAAAASVYALNSEYNKVDATNEAVRSGSVKVAAAQRDMAKAFAESKGEVNDTVMSSIAVQLEAVSEQTAAVAKNGPGSMAIFKAGAEDIKGWFSGVGQAGTDALNAQEDQASAAQGMIDKLNELGITNEDLGAALGGTDLAWAHMASTLRDGSDAGQAAYEKYSALREEIVRSREAAQFLTPGFIDLAGAVDTLADKSSTADDRLNALKTALDVLMGRQVPLSEAVADYNKAINEIAGASADAVDKTKGFGDALVNTDGSVNTLTVNGGLLRDSLIAVKDASLQAADAAARDALAHGKTVPEAQDAAVDAIARNREALMKLASDYGVPIDQIERMIEAEGLMPDNIKALVTLDGADAATKQLFELNGLIQGVPSGVPVEIRMDDQVAKDNLRELGYAVEEIPNGNVKITAPNDLALAGLQEVLDRTLALGAASATPRIDADTTGFRLGAEQSRTELEQLDLSSADPRVGAIIDDLLNNKTVSLQALSEIDQTKANPEIILAIQNALRDASVVDKELDRIANKQRVAEIAMRVKSGELSFGEGFSQAFPVIPKRADGGRLPTTGPGTSITDGIMGVAASGMPIARVDAGEWVINGRSSQAYDRELAMINAGVFPKLPGFASGGVVGGMEEWVRAVQPGLTLTSGMRNTDNGYHSTGQAADFSNGSGNTLEQLALAEAIADAYPESLELIYDDPAFAGREIKNGQRVDSSFYDGAGDHTNHVHWALATPPSLDRMPGVGDAAMVPLTDREMIAQAIIDEGKRRGITTNGIRAALAAGLAESNLENLSYGDRDSVGVFQQRDNGAWGTAEDRMDPARAAGMFYDKLVSFDYDSMDPALAAQKVQQSAFADGSNYAAKLAEADAILAAAESRSGMSVYGLEPEEISDGKTGFEGAANSKWTEKDKLDLESAIVAIRQAQDDRDAAYANDKKSQADREQADIKVRQAEQKVRDLEAKRDTPNMIKNKDGKDKSPAPNAPELTTNLNDDEISLKSAELAVEKARLARNEVYAEDGVTEAEKLDADLSLQRAKNALDAERKEQAEGKSSGKGGGSGSKSQASDPVDLLGNVAKSFVTGQLSDALGVFGLSNDLGAIGALITGVANYAPVDVKGGEAAVGLEQLFGAPFAEEIGKAAAATPNAPFDPDQWLKDMTDRLRVPAVLRDKGGPLPSGYAALNLSGETEHVYTAQQNRDMFKELADTRAAVAGGGGVALDMREFTRQVDRLAENSSRPNVTYQTENIQAAIREETVRRVRESRSYSRR